MKGFNILLVFLFGYFSCLAQEQSKALPSSDSESGTFFGQAFEFDTLKDKKEIWQKYTHMAVSDTLNIQFKSKVKEVCKVKGCWMVVELPEGEQAMIRFKDYGFFMPSDIVNKEVILNGIAFVEEMSVEDQRHFAKDAGKNSSDISKINTPKRTFSFEASGVLVPN